MIALAGNRHLAERFLAFGEGLRAFAKSEGEGEATRLTSSSAGVFGERVESGEAEVWVWAQQFAFTFAGGRAAPREPPPRALVVFTEGADLAEQAEATRALREDPVLHAKNFGLPSPPVYVCEVTGGASSFWSAEVPFVHAQVGSFSPFDSVSFDAVLDSLARFAAGSPQPFPTPAVESGVRGRPDPQGSEGALARGFASARDSPRMAAGIRILRDPKH